MHVPADARCREAYRGACHNPFLVLTTMIALLLLLAVAVVGQGAI